MGERSPGAVSRELRRESIPKGTRDDRLDPASSSLLILIEGRNRDDREALGFSMSSVASSFIERPDNECLDADLDKARDECLVCIEEGRPSVSPVGTAS